MKPGMIHNEPVHEAAIPGGVAVQLATMIVLVAFFACCLDAGGQWIGGGGRYGVAVSGSALLLLLLLRGRLCRRWSRRWVNPLSITLSAAVWLWLLSPPAPEALREQGQALIDALEHAAVEHGSYPTSLEDIGLALPVSRYGWTYATNTHPARFELSVGVFQRDGFELSYQSEQGEWTEDR